MRINSIKINICQNNKPASKLNFGAGNIIPPSIGILCTFEDFAQKIIQKTDPFAEEFEKSLGFIKRQSFDIRLQQFYDNLGSFQKKSYFQALNTTTDEIIYSHPEPVTANRKIELQIRDFIVGLAKKLNEIENKN